jgi:hypothetical protein
MKARPASGVLAVLFACGMVYAAHSNGGEQGAERTAVFPDPQVRATSPARYNTLIYNELHGKIRDPLVDNRYSPKRSAFSRSYPASEEGVLYYGDTLYYGPPETYRSMR